MGTFGGSFGQAPFGQSDAPQTGLAVGTTALDNAVIGTAYSATLQAVGGEAPYSWSIVVGSLPSGLTLSGATISGTPDGVAEIDAVRVRVTDHANATADATLTIQVVPAAPTALPALSSTTRTRQSARPVI